MKKSSLQDGEKNISIEPSKINLEIDFELKYENLNWDIKEIN